MFSKNCPICEYEIIYKNKDGLTYSIKHDSYCRLCKGKKISIKLKNVKKSESHRKSLSNAKNGSFLTKDHKANIGKSLKGIKRSEESRLNYSLSKMGDKNPSKQEWVKEKIRNSIIELYKNNPDIKDRISKSVTKFFLENPNYCSMLEIDNFTKYKKIVRNLTNRNKKELIINWNGMDYYDGEYIKDNFKLNYNDDNYPTIDHKISLLEGYKCGYDPEKISCINNLCLTKRKLNIKKGFLNIDIFIEKMGLTK